MHIFHGILDWPSPAMSEEITLILPNELRLNGPALLARETVSGVADASREVRVVHAAVSERTEDPERAAFNFLSDPPGRLRVEFHAGGNSLDVILEENGASSRSVMQKVVALSPTVEALLNKLTTIINDTNAIYYCSLDESSDYTSAKSITLAGIGVFYAFLGLATLPSGVPAVIGAAVAVQGAVFASGAMADSLIPRDGPVACLLMPKRQMARLSEKDVFVAPSNDLSLTRLVVCTEKDPDTEETIAILKATVATRKNLGDDKFGLAAIVAAIDALPPESGGWQELLTLSLGSGAKPPSIEACAVVTVLGLGTPRRGDHFTIRSNLIGAADGAVFIYSSGPAAGADPMRFDPFYDTDLPIFELQDKRILAFISGNKNSLTGKDKVISTGDAPRNLVWRLPNYGVRGGTNGDILSRQGSGQTQAGTEAEAEMIIFDNRDKGYVAYSWTRSRQTVIGYRVGCASRLEPHQEAEGLVYIAVQEEKPFMRLQPG